MAADTKARMSVSLYDNAGGKANFLAHAFIDSAQTVAAVTAALATLSTNLATVMNAGIKEASFSVLDTAVAAAPASTANVSLVGNLGFTVAGSPSRFGLSVPSYLESLIGADGTIDMTAGATNTFATYILAAVLGGHFTNNAYVNYAAIQKGFRSGRKFKR